MLSESKTQKHHIIKPLSLFLFFWTPVIIFLKLAGEVIEKEPLPLDISLLEWLHSHASAFLDTFFLYVTNIGGIVGVAAITALFIAYFLYKKRNHAAMFLFMSVAGSSIANLILKAIFHRDRPSLWQQTAVEHSFSFPSGHAMASAALVSCLIFIYFRTKNRWPVVISGAIAVVLVGLSRLYLGVHYPSDILAGWSISVIWVYASYVFLAEYNLEKPLSTLFKTFSKQKAHGRLDKE